VIALEGGDHEPREVRCRLCGARWILSANLNRCPGCGESDFFFTEAPR
jgi:rubrerythrin